MIDIRKKPKSPSPEILKMLALSGLSQQELANKLGTTSSKISDYKRGIKAMSVNTLKSWCKILDIDIKKLF